MTDDAPRSNGAYRHREDGPPHEEGGHREDSANRESTGGYNPPRESSGYNPPPREASQEPLERPETHAAPEAPENREARPVPQQPAQPEHKTVAHFEPTPAQQEGNGSRQSKPYVVWSSAPASGGGGSRGSEE